MNDSARNQKVLVVEDLPLSANLLAAVLRSFGCEVDIVENGEQAVESVKQQTFDAILMDIEMPVMDGLEATRIIRSLGVSNGAEAVPILAYTARNSPAERAECEAAGMSDYIDKTSGRRVIFDALRKWRVISEEAVFPEIISVAVDQSAFDPTRLEDLVRMVPGEKLKSVLAITIGQLRQAAEAMENSTSDSSELRWHFHRLISLLGNVGYIGLSKKADEIEEMLRGGQIPDAQTLADYRHSLENVIECVNGYCDRKV